MEKGYVSDGLFVTNVKNNVGDKFDYYNKFTFTTCSTSIWHRLGDANYHNVKKNDGFRDYS